MKRSGMMAGASLAVAIFTSCAGDIQTISDADVARGGELYQANCASCHGADLAGAAKWNPPSIAATTSITCRPGPPNAR